MVTVHAFSMRSVHLGGLAEERNIHPMYDMEQYSFWKILDKMTDPVQREKKYTGEDPESQLRQLFFCMFVCFCVPPQVQHLSGGKFHRFWDDNILFVIFFFVCSARSSPLKIETGSHPLLFQQRGVSTGDLDGAAAVVGFVLLGVWVCLKWSRPGSNGLIRIGERRGASLSVAFLLGSSVLRSNKKVCVWEGQWALICSITHFFLLRFHWDSV